MKLFSVFLILAALISTTYAAEKRAFTIADLYKIKNVENPTFSPDGKRIAFSVREDNLEKGTSNSEIYVMNADGTNIHQMTDDPASDTEPKWSPDGKSILFTSTRKDGAQAWLIPTDGGEAKQLTSFVMGVENLDWVSDGKRIVFSTSVFPECGADNDCNKKNEDGLNNGPLQAHMADDLLYRHWTFWLDGKRAHTLIYEVDSKKYIDLTPGNFDWPSFSTGGGGFAVSPDGAELCVTSNHDPNEESTTNKDLWIVPTTGGTPKNITEANKAADSDPQYSPDGKYIAFIMQTVPGFESDRLRLALYDRKSGAISELTLTFDNWVADFKWAPDSQSIYFTGEVKGLIPLFNVNVKTKKVVDVLTSKTIEAFDVSSDGASIVFGRRGIQDPREIWRADITGRNAKRITFFNKELEEAVDIRPAEEMWIDSPTGKKIHTFIVKPHNFDPNKKYPVILNVHGGPQSQWADAFRGDWQVYPGAGYIVAFPNPHGSTGYGQEFTNAISKDWHGKVYQDVMAVADALEKLPFVDKDRMGAMGWSYGGYFMMWLEGHTTRFKALASMMGVYNLKAMYGATEELWFPEWDLGGVPWKSDLYVKDSPNEYVESFKTPCLVITGERDYRVPYTQSLEFFTHLQKMNVPSRLIVFKEDGHWPSGIKSMPFYYNAHLDWFHKYLGGDPAPYDMIKMQRNLAYEK
ncbi:MAG TPA: S9 family peptidase [Acidobacteriota bacterium]|nr:S9 family peptidase [Acidobacteriota bacterium]